MCVSVSEREKAKCLPGGFPSIKSWTFLPLFGFGGGEIRGLGRWGVKAVVIETQPNQTHYHFYQFAPPKMLIR